MAARTKTKKAASTALALPRTTQLAARIVESRIDILKAQGDRGDSHVQQHPDESTHYFTGVGAIEPPYDPWVLLTLIEHSTALRQCVDSYVTNIDASGHRFEPIIDLSAPDADDRVKSYLMARLYENHPQVVLSPSAQVRGPTQEQVEAAKLEIAEAMRAERTRLSAFFDCANLDTSFVTLRRRMRQDLEGQGNAYWEVQRQEDGAVCGFEFIPAFTVRHMRADTRSTCVEVPVKKNEFDFTTIETRRRFRRFVQVFEQQVTYFKEFGDPRVVSAKTGAYYKSVDDLRVAEGRQAIAATEIMHFKVHSSKSSYGVPRWVGTLLAVIGSRQSEEVNVSYFDNKSVPPLAVLVQGGRITDETVTRIQEHIDHNIKGKANFHKLLILEAESQGGSMAQDGRTKIDLKPLTSAQHNDALFQSYDANNIDKVGMSFRLPRMLRGDIRDFNRATAEAALDFTESQVFKPERDEFDETINRKILPALDVRYWRFRSNGSSAQNPKDLAEMVTGMVDKAILTPAEGRDIAQGVFGKEFRKIDAPWTRQPLELSKLGIAPPDELLAPGMVTPQEAASGLQQTPTGATQPAPTAPGAGAATPAPGGSIKLTGTDLASVFTVNEARAEAGKGNLKLQDGTDDPDGFLTVTEFKAKRLAAGQVTGADEGKDEAATGTPQKALPQGKAGMLAFAQQLLELRKAMTATENVEAMRIFEETLAATAKAEDPAAE